MFHRTRPAPGRIGLKKRVWKHVSWEEVVAIETAVVEAALGVGAPAFAGQAVGKLSKVQSRLSAACAAVLGATIDNARLGLACLP